MQLNDPTPAPDKNFCGIRYRDGKAPDGSPVWKACPGRVREAGQRCPTHGGTSTVHEPAIERIALLRADLQAAGALTPGVLDLLDTTTRLLREADDHPEEEAMQLTEPRRTSEESAASRFPWDPENPGDCFSRCAAFVVGEDPDDSDVPRPSAKEVELAKGYPMVGFNTKLGKWIHDRGHYLICVPAETLGWSVSFRWDTPKELPLVIVGGPREGDGLGHCVVSRGFPGQEEAHVAYNPSESQIATVEDFTLVVPVLERGQRFEPTNMTPPEPRSETEVELTLSFTATQYETTSRSTAGGAKFVVARVAAEPLAWAVRDGVGGCLTHDGDWEREPQPSDRTAAFKGRTRWPTSDRAKEALTAWTRSSQLFGRRSSKERASQAQEGRS